MLIRNIQNEYELSESRLLCYQAYKQNIDDCPSLEAAMNMFLHSPSSIMKREWRNSLAAFDDEGTMFAHISNAVSPINFDGGTSNMCAIGDVACIKKGTDAIRALFQAILSQRREEGVAFSYLFPFSGRYYSQFGYSYCVMSKKWMLSLNQLEQVKQDLLVRSYDPSDAPYIEKIQKPFVTRYNLSMQRQDINWHTARDLFHLNTKVAVSHENIPVGYLTYTTRGQEDTSVKITDFAVTSPAVLNALIVSFLPEKQKAYLVVPEVIPLELMIPELNLQSSVCQYQNNGMVRIVALEKALRTMRYQGSGSLILEVDDSLLLENTGIWELSWLNGQAQTVKRISNREADIILSIDQLSRFVCSGITKETLQFYPNIPQNMEQTMLNCFPKKLVGVFDYF